MLKSLWMKLVVGAALLSLTACSGGGDSGGGSNGGGVVTPPSPVAVQNQFGGVFSTAFAADPNAAAGPIDPQPGDLPPISLTTDPIDF